MGQPVLAGIPSKVLLPMCSCRWQLSVTFGLRRRRQSSPQWCINTSQPPSSSLRITDHSFRYASPCLWNQLPTSLRQPHPSPSDSYLPVHAPTTSSHSVNSSLSPSRTPSLFHSRLKTYLCHKSFPTTHSLPASGLITRT